MSDPNFGCLCADPPWAFRNTRTRAAAENHYKTLEEHEIAAFTIHGYPVHQVMAENAHLYLWTTDSHLESALRVMRVWGFEPKQTIVWVKVSESGKVQIGLGNWYRHAHEICLFGTRGSALARVRDLPSVFWAPRGKHSSKPEQLQDWAEQLSPGPYIELFARRQRPNWYCFGDQVQGVLTGT